MKISVDAEIDSDEIANMDASAVYDFIVAIDKKIDNETFSATLAAYFANRVSKIATMGYNCMDCGTRVVFHEPPTHKNNIEYYYSCGCGISQGICSCCGQPGNKFDKDNICKKCLGDDD